MAQLVEILYAGRRIAFDAVWTADPALAGLDQAPNLYLVVRVGAGRTASAQTRPYFIAEVQKIVPGASVAVEDYEDVAEELFPEAAAVWASMAEITDQDLPRRRRITLSLACHGSGGSALRPPDKTLGHFWLRHLPGSAPAAGNAVPGPPPIPA